MNPASKHLYENRPVICTYEHIIEAIQNDEIFGFLKLGIHEPKEIVPKFSEFPPLFKNVETPLSPIGTDM